MKILAARRTSLIFLNATSVAYLITFVKGLLVRGMVTVAEYGDFVNMQLLLSYGVMTQIGLFNALNFLLPAQFHRADSEATSRDVGSVMGFVSVVWGIVLVLLVALWSVPANGIDRFALTVTGLTLAITMWVGVGENVLRGRQDFHKLSWLAIARESAIFAVSVSAIFMLGAHGLYLGVFAGALLAALMISPTLVGFTPNWRMSNMLRLVRIGFPMFVSGIISSLILLSAQTVALAQLSSTQIGELSFGLLMYSAVLVVPSVASQIVYPKLLVMAAGAEPSRTIGNFYARTFSAYSLGLAVISCGICLGSALLIRYVLPDYANGLAPAVILSAALVLVGANSMHGMVITAIGRAPWVVLINALGLGVAILLSIILVDSQGPIGVAVSVAGAMMAVNFASALYVSRQLGIMSVSALLRGVFVPMILLVAPMASFLVFVQVDLVIVFCYALGAVAVIMVYWRRSLGWRA